MQARDYNWPKEPVVADAKAKEVRRDLADIIDTTFDQNGWNGLIDRFVKADRDRLSARIGME